MEKIFLSNASDSFVANLAIDSEIFLVVLSVIYGNQSSIEPLLQLPYLQLSNPENNFRGRYLSK